MRIIRNYCARFMIRPSCSNVKGRLNAKDKNAVAMVGSRMTTHYGVEVARKLA